MLDPTPATTPSDALAHPTGATDIVLSFDEAGGFVPPEFFAAHVPLFTLYGDGTVVFVRSSAQVPQRQDNVVVGQPIRTAHLTEDQVQALLLTSLREGGLAVAKESYTDMTVSDAPTAVFEVHADNDTKSVSVYALGIEGQPGPDTAVLTALAKLGERLRDFDQGGALASEPYVPAAYRGVLLAHEGVTGVQVREWPWVDLQPSDFKLPADPNVLQQQIHTLGANDVAALNIQGFESGIASGIWLKGPDGKVYSLAIRPLLSHEKA